VDGEGSGRFGHILRNRAKAGTGLGGARGKIRLARELMRNGALLRHALCVPLRRKSQRGVPFQGRQTLRAPVAIGGVKQYAFRVRCSLLRNGGTGKQE
jgi:hypothetical protein